MAGRPEQKKKQKKEKEASGVTRSPRAQRRNGRGKRRNDGGFSVQEASSGKSAGGEGVRPTPTSATLVET
jgi:hypothetical protein